MPCQTWVCGEESGKECVQQAFYAVFHEWMLTTLHWEASHANIEYKAGN